jgi:putative acetyltransferase
VIRPLRPDDARAVAELQVRAWRRAYADFVGEDRMPDVAGREACWRAMPPERAWVWDQDGVVAGVAGMAGDELQVLYVDPPAQGAGVGSALLEHVVGQGARVVWVFEANGHGRAFYEARGWRHDGGRQDRWPGTHEVRYRLER